MAIVLPAYWTPCPKAYKTLPSISLPDREWPRCWWLSIRNSLVTGMTLALRIERVAQQLEIYGKQALVRLYTSLIPAWKYSKSTYTHQPVGNLQAPINTLAPDMAFARCPATTDLLF